MKKILLTAILSAASLQSYALTKSNIIIDNIVQIAHSDGFNENGNFKGVNTYQGTLQLKKENIYITFGFNVEERDKVLSVFFGDPKDTKENFMKSVDKTTKILSENKISIDQLESEVKQELTTKLSKNLF